MLTSLTSRRVLLLSHRQHGHTGWLDGKMKSGYLEEPGVGCFVKKGPLLETWQDLKCFELALLLEGLKRSREGTYDMSDGMCKMFDKSLKLDALDLSDGQINHFRASTVLTQVHLKGAIWKGPGWMRSVAWWPKDHEGVLKVLAAEIGEKKQEEEEEARRLSKMQQPVDPEVKARVLKWRLGVLPEDPAEARFWIEEEPATFKRPDLDMTATAAVEHATARGQGGPLNESAASNIASSGAKIRAVDGRNVKEEGFTLPRAADSNIVSNSRTQSAKRKRGE